MKLTNKMVHDIRKILVHYGPDAEKEKAMEELLELKNEVFSDLYGGYAHTDDIKEEIADVYIVLEHLKNIYHFTDQEVMEVMRAKVDRQLRRIENENC